MFDILYVIILVHTSTTFAKCPRKSNYYWRDYFPGNIPEDAIEGCADRYIGQVQSNYYWRDYFPGNIPEDAIEGCADRYIGQVHHVRGDLVANIYPQNETAVTEEEGKVIYTRNIRIFCTPTPKQYRWEKIDVSKPFEGQMENAVKGGLQANINENLFIGKAFHEGECKIGKVIPMPNTYKGLWVWYNADGQPARFDEFYILKDTATHSQLCTVG
ncbi:Protein of unknown function (DUF3421) [Popillia japonica]|uniref:Uncharacterized protein n=1 Tax=Popillia japonica TaxID=7064 RepID=A0AAW1N0H7_POPJA